MRGPRLRFLPKRNTGLVFIKPNVNNLAQRKRISNPQILLVPALSPAAGAHDSGPIGLPDHQHCGAESIRPWPRAARP